MNYKSNLKVKHHIGDLINFIEQNDLQGFIKILQEEPKLIKRRGMDDNEPIFYAIKLRSNKIFKYIVETSRSQGIDFDVKIY
jgi:hypothetical protein